MAGSDKPFARAINLADSDNIKVPLMKSSFTFDNVEGKLKQIKLRCEAKFKSLEFVSDADYSVPESWGRCQIEILGDKNTSAQLIQL